MWWQGPQSKCKKVSRTEMQNKKSVEQNLLEDPWTCSDGDPKSKCKKVSGTKMHNKIAEQKASRTKIVGG